MGLTEFKMNINKYPKNLLTTMIVDFRMELIKMIECLGTLCFFKVKRTNSHNCKFQNTANENNIKKLTNFHQCKFQNTAPCSTTEFNTNTICPEPDQGMGYGGLTIISCINFTLRS
jgi:hypothetical protein